MANTAHLTADYIRAGMRSLFGKSHLKKTQAAVQAKSDTAKDAFLGTVKLHDSLDEWKQADQQFKAAEQDFASASEGLKDEEDVSKRFSALHTEAYRRLKAADKVGDDDDDEFVFVETMPAFEPTLPSVKRSQSKRYKFESAFDAWRREVEEAFADYAAIEEFPSPPGRCRGVRCKAGGKGERYTCACVIREAFAEVDDLEGERRRWHPRRFAVCRAERRTEFQERAREIFTEVSSMVMEGKDMK